MRTYVVQSGSSDYYKIGKTTRAVESRVKELQVGNPETLKIKKILHGDLEGYYHTKFANKRVNGEWFKLSKSDLKRIKQLDYSPGFLNQLTKLALWGGIVYILIQVLL